jgi:hypothetical protein
LRRFWTAASVLTLARARQGALGSAPAAGAAAAGLSGVMGAAALQVSTTRPTAGHRRRVRAWRDRVFCGASGLLRAF